MVTTRSQSNQNRQTENGTMNRSSDSESETSFPDVLSRDQIADLDSEDVLTRRQNNNNYDIDHRFNEINRQIGDLTDIVLSLTNQVASVNGEGNRLNAVTTNTNSRSDSALSDTFSQWICAVKWASNTGLEAAVSKGLAQSHKSLTAHSCAFLFSLFSAKYVPFYH